MIETVSADAFIKHIAPMVEKCPDFVIKREVIMVVADICRRTGVIRTSLELETEPDVSEYEMDVCNGLRVEQVRHCYNNGTELRPILFDEYSNRTMTDWRETSGTPWVYSFRHRNHLTLIPIPNDVYPITVDAVVSVDTDTTVVPETFFNNYLDIVVDGALSRIHRLAGQPYSSTEMATFYAVRYESGITRIKLEVTRDFTRRAGTVGFNRIV